MPGASQGFPPDGQSPEGARALVDVPEVDPQVLRLVRRAIDVCGFLTVALGIVVTAGWLLGLEAVTRVVPGLPSMKMNTALGFVTSGLALLLLHPGRILRWGWAGSTLALVPLLIGLATLVQYAFGLDLGIDQALVIDAGGGATPGRPSPITGLTLALTGGALVAVPAGASRLPTQVLAGAGLILALLGLLGYLYDASLIRHARSFTSMALHTVIGFHILLAGVLLLCSESGFVRLLLANDAGGLVARRLVPTVVTFGVLFGWARIQAQRMDLIDTNSGVALLVTAVCGFVVIVALGTASVISRKDRALHANLKLLVTAEHHLVSHVAALREAQARLRLSEEKMRLTFMHSPVGSAIVSLDGRFEEVNEALCRMVGYRADELRGMTLRALTHPDDLAQDLGQIQALLDKDVLSYNLEKRYVHRDGHSVWVRTSVAMVRNDDGTPRHFIKQVEDLSRHRQAEQDAARVLRELEAFSYSVAHDLRAPLRAISGFTRLLAGRPAIADDPKALELMKLVDDGAAHMGRLIDDLLRLSKVERSEFRRERVNLSELVQQIFERLARDSNPPPQLTVQPGLVTEADPHLLHIALENLLSNALKYKVRGQAARVEVGAVGDGVARRYFVRDHGVGFDMAYAAKLFQPFQRLHSPSEYEGTGIGLATVQRVIERHGGTIAGEGRVGAGATFTFTLHPA